MTESHGQELSRWITTVIMSTALQNHEISTILQRQHHRVRYSESVETGSVIFSLSGVAFLLSDTQDLLMRGEEQFSKRIQKFINIHRNSFLVLSAALHGPEEWNVMFRIQRSKEQPCVLMASILPFDQISKIQTKFRPAVFGSKIIDRGFCGSRFLGSNLRVIPVHNTAETVKLMLTIAKVTSKPQADDARYKMTMTKAQIIENSPVWKMLQEYHLQSN